MPEVLDLWRHGGGFPSGSLGAPGPPFWSASGWRTRTARPAPAFRRSSWAVESPLWVETVRSCVEAARPEAVIDIADPVCRRSWQPLHGQHRTVSATVHCPGV